MMEISTVSMPSVSCIFFSSIIIEKHRCGLLSLSSYLKNKFRELQKSVLILCLPSHFNEIPQGKQEQVAYYDSGIFWIIPAIINWLGEHYHMVFFVLLEVKGITAFKLQPSIAKNKSKYVKKLHCSIHMEIYTHRYIFLFEKNHWKKNFRRVKHNGGGLNSSLRR